MTKNRIILANNNFYRKWSNDRDEAAERLLDNSKRRTTDFTNRAFIAVLHAIFLRFKHLSPFDVPNKQAIDQLEKYVGQIFENAAHEIYIETLNLRQRAWMLSHVAEAVAIGALRKARPKVQASINDIAKLDHLDPKLLHRISFAFNKLRRQIIQKVEQAIIQGDDVNQAMGRIYLALPKLQHMTKVRKLKRLAKVREAGFDPEDRGSDAIAFSSNGLVDWHFDKTTWQKVQDEYENEYLNVDRSPASVFDIKNPFNDEPIRDDIPTNEAFYGWEVEQEVTHDFVTAVRQGEISAAKENGVDDFLWIAIIDAKTCVVCCEWRDGLTSKEIEAKLEEDPSLKDECDAIVPPAHFNCRCRVAPYSESLGSAEPNTDVELDEWLTNLE